jgi:hypothetical protein
VFVRDGTLFLLGDAFTNNTAAGGAAGGGTAQAGMSAGGAIFAYEVGGALVTELGAAPTFNNNTAGGAINNISGLVAADKMATLTATAGSGQSALINKAFGTNLQATLTSNGSTGLANVVPPFFGPSTGAGLAAPAAGVTNANGQVSVAVAANSTVGSYTVTVGSGLQATFSLQNAPPPPVPLVVLAGSGGGLTGLNNGQILASGVSAYPGYVGTVSTAIGDVNGDGVPDLATVTSSPGAPAVVQVFSGVNFAQLLRFAAFPAFYTGGASIALGDLTGSGKADIIVGALSGISAVAVFDSTGTLLSQFLAYPEAPIGVRVAAGDLTGSGEDTILTIPVGIAPLVREYTITGALVTSFMAFSPSIPAGGFTIAAGDLTGTGRSDIIVGAAYQGLDYALVFNPDTTMRQAFQLPGAPTMDPNPEGPEVQVGSLGGFGPRDLVFVVGDTLGALGGTSLVLLGAIPIPN